jgi:hypothetical protein
MDKMDINKYEYTSFFDVLFVWQNWFFHFKPFSNIIASTFRLKRNFFTLFFIDFLI